MTTQNEGGEGGGGVGHELPLHSAGGGALVHRRGGPGAVLGVLMGTEPGSGGCVGGAGLLEAPGGEGGGVGVAAGGGDGVGAGLPGAERFAGPAAIGLLEGEDFVDQLFRRGAGGGD